MQRQANTDIVIALVGNKLDLARDDLDTQEDQDQTNDESNEENERQVPKEDAQAYADEAGLLFYETSAKSAYNVDNLFAAIAKKIPLENMHSSGGSRGTGRNPSGLNHGVNLMQQSSTSNNSGSCAC